MSRVIKFRALNVVTKQWIYFALSNTKGNLSMQLLQLDDDLWAQPEDIQTVYTALTEYTGHEDRKGTEIYEGDIVDKDHDEYLPALEVVKWDDDYSGFNPFHDVGDGWGQIVASDCEVIGNVWDNPELKESMEED